MYALMHGYYVEMHGGLLIVSILSVEDKVKVVNCQKVTEVSFRQRSQTQKVSYQIFLFSDIQTRAEGEWLYI